MKYANYTELTKESDTALINVMTLCGCLVEVVTRKVCKSTKGDVHKMLDCAYVRYNNEVYAVALDPFDVPYIDPESKCGKGWTINSIK